ncbi:UvrD-helicase domain-containing protein [Candidatus Symbiobacter mobilis]|uniref:DNA 3'-5' helicase n=1 Tax=Candidatus Symbiobacter mobilis CR TaxID=946483 RepID=U5NDJ3_9BURK|nr:UvrD-helicase domain-containing protein [Candidatus Symbiobacter mobilis]AGX88308.1 exonuclease V subunit beta [Candidatus Symbiobacter mobilis CR]
MKPTPQDWLAEDTAHRARAIDPTGSFLVEAPAGAGKTELLTQRFLALLARVEEPEEVVALTFTRKAAGEMRNRVVQSLRMAQQGERPSQPHKQTTFDLSTAVLRRDAERHWGLMEHGGRLQITTLDALCGQLVRQMPLLSELGSQPGIAEDPDLLYEQAVQDTLEELESDTPLAHALDRILDRHDNQKDKLSALLIAMLQRRDQWMHHALVEQDREASLAVFRALIEQDLRDIHKAMPNGWFDSLQALMPAVAGHLLATQAAPAQTGHQPPSPTGRGAGGECATAEPYQYLLWKNLAAWHKPLQPTLDDWPIWRALADLLLTVKNELRKQIPAAWGLNKEDRQALQQTLAQGRACECDAHLARIRTLPHPAYTDDDRQCIEDVTLILREAAARLWLVFQARSEVDFIEMAGKALVALGGEDAPSDLQLRLDYRISHLLVDEFQDTGPTQVQLLQKLTAGWQPCDGRTLFLVGDPMQSIYRFRKADVGLFLRVRELGLGSIRPTVLRLYRNNRSHDEVVDWVNHTFPKVMPPSSDAFRGAVAFEPAVATIGPSPQAQVVIHPIIETGAAGLGVDDAAGAEEADAADGAVDAFPPALSEREANTVVGLIRAARQADPEVTVAVLVRARSHLLAVAQALRNDNLPYQAVEIDTLQNVQVVQDLLSLTRALLHPGDRVHWLAVLRAPWCGLTLADLHALAGGEPYRTVWQCMQDDGAAVGTEGHAELQASVIHRLSPDGRQRLHHVRTVVGEALQHRGHQRLRRWVEGVWRGLNGPACLTTPAEFAYARAYFDLLDRLDQEGAIDLPVLQTAVAELYTPPDPAAPTTLQLMTIHKAKGLEFDCVIVPGIHHGAKLNERALVAWEEWQGEGAEPNLAVAAMERADEAPDKNAPPSLHQYLCKLETDRTEQETRRLLYVAATRARRALHWVGVAKVKQDGNLAAPRAGSFLKLLWPVAEARFDERLAQAKEQVGQAEQCEGNAHAAGAAVPARFALPCDATFVPTLIRLRNPVPPPTWERPGAQHAGDFGIDSDIYRDTYSECTPAEINPKINPVSDRNIGGNINGDSDPEPTSTAPSGQSADPLPADIGTLVHRYLEAMARDGLQGWTGARLQRLEPAMRRWLLARGHPQAQADDAARQTLAHLRTTLQSEMGRWILQRHEEDACELPISTLAGPDDTAQRGYDAHVVDRTFVDNGVRWIVDYKTTRAMGEGGATQPEATLPPEALEQYREQLLRYRSLFDAEQPVRMGVFWTTVGRWVEV